MNPAISEADHQRAQPGAPALLPGLAAGLGVGIGVLGGALPPDLGGRGLRGHARTEPHAALPRPGAGRRGSLPGVAGRVEQGLQLAGSAAAGPEAAPPRTGGRADQACSVLTSESRVENPAGSMSRPFIRASLAAARPLAGRHRGGVVEELRRMAGGPARRQRAGQGLPGGDVTFRRGGLAAQRLQQAAFGQQGRAVLADDDRAGVDRAVGEARGVQAQQRLGGLDEDRGGAAGVGSPPELRPAGEQVGHRRDGAAAGDQPDLAVGGHQVGDRQQPVLPRLGQPPIGGNRPPPGAHARPGRPGDDR